MGLPLIPKEFFGSHWSQEELLTALYLENVHLRKNTIDNTPLVALKPPSVAQVSDEPEYQIVREFLKHHSRRTGANRHLVLTNDYPDYGKEYGNGFVHRRIRAYMDAGLTIDVMLFNKRAARRVYEFDRVRVLSGGAHELNGLLAAQAYNSISAHFFNREMWNTLYHHRRSCLTPLHVYVHGYDARHWMRRRHDIQSHGDLRNAIERSNSLREFWTELATSIYRPDSFIFVSQYWRELMQQDMDIDIPHGHGRVIHNFIDGDLFKYQKKEPQQRFRILWARSATSRHYGADIGVDVLRKLLDSRHGPRVEATVVGDGQYFDLFEAAFKDDPRVSISRGFVTQDRVADLHKSHGFFLVPTRLDTQGVSRDEAMSSGLVPITNAVAAVPEFVDNECGVVAPSEDASSMAERTLKLMDDPDQFSAKSLAASLRVRSQSGRTFTIDREIAMMEGASVE